MKINVVGPLISDTVFINEYKKFDVIIGHVPRSSFSLLKLYLNSMQ